MDDKNSNDSIPQYIRDKIDLATKAVVADVGRDNAKRNDLHIALLRVEAVKANAELMGAMRANIAPVGESQRILTASIAVAKLAELGKVLSQFEGLAELEPSRFDLQVGELEPFSGTYGEFKEWAEEHYWNLAK